MPDADLVPEAAAPKNALGIVALQDERNRRFYRREDAERLLGLKPRSLSKTREGVEVVTRNDGKYADADAVDRERRERLFTLGVADVPRTEGLETLQATVWYLEGEVQQCLSEIRKLALVANVYNEMYMGRLPVGTLND